MQDSTPERNPANGQLLPGNTANPSGKNGHNDGWQRYGDRLQKWFAVPVREIASYLDDEGEKLKSMSSIDGACIRHVINTISGKNTLAYLKEALDRIEGTPKQTIAHTGDKDDPISFTLKFATLPEIEKPPETPPNPT